MITVSDKTRIVPHFTLREQANLESGEEPKFKCETPEAVEHQYMIEDLRMWAVENHPSVFKDSGLIVSSGYRNPIFNKQVGGASNSAHLDSRATDFSNIPQYLYNEFMIAWQVICSRYKKIGGVEYGNGYMHFDSFSDKFGSKSFRVKDNR